MLGLVEERFDLLGPNRCSPLRQQVGLLEGGAGVVKGKAGTPSFRDVGGLLFDGGPHECLCTVAAQKGAGRHCPGERVLLRYFQKDYLVPKAVTARRDDASAVRVGIPRVRWLAWA